MRRVIIFDNLRGEYKSVAAVLNHCTRDCSGFYDRNRTFIIWQEYFLLSAYYCCCQWAVHIDHLRLISCRPLIDLSRKLSPMMRSECINHKTMVKLRCFQFFKGWRGTDWHIVKILRQVYLLLIRSTFEWSTSSCIQIFYMISLSPKYILLFEYSHFCSFFVCCKLSSRLCLLLLRFLFSFVLYDLSFYSLFLIFLT